MASTAVTSESLAATNESPSKKRRIPSGVLGISPDYTSEGTKKRRSQKESRKCSKRHGERCMITKTIHPAGCHIVPFSWSESVKNTQTMAKLLGLFTQFFFEQDEDPSLLCKEPGCADKAWNMLCLSPTLHTWWSHALFGFKRIGLSPLPGESSNLGVITEVTLQFHWLPTPKGINHLQKVDLTKQRFGNKESLRYKLDNDAKVVDVKVNLPSDQPIRTGHTFIVHIPTEDLREFCVVIDLQWALMRIASMSAFAETIALEDDEGPDIKGWLQGVLNFPPQSVSHSPERVSYSPEQVLHSPERVSRSPERRHPPDNPLLRPPRSSNIPLPHATDDKMTRPVRATQNTSQDERAGVTTEAKELAENVIPTRLHRTHSRDDLSEEVEDYFIESQDSETWGY
ncbi:HNH endonuclease domain-containing protein [Penicillium taxi]|uniref:HNH endonuclease domain-containing protein n=1 Tax=Penicillium taxi TaxID=168475 RepID=UPI0025456A91|nr:HNH endonuclease domain-containing protein [Penicillium taxi]KAJ5893491.1 HNH endonuclease domain-containing protein [Penicillium taxi]